MKKIIFLLGLLVVVMFIISCAPTDEAIAGQATKLGKDIKIDKKGKTPAECPKGQVQMIDRKGAPQFNKDGTPLCGEATQKIDVKDALKDAEFEVDTPCRIIDEPGAIVELNEDIIIGVEEQLIDLGEGYNPACIIIRAPDVVVRGSALIKYNGNVLASGILVDGYRGEAANVNIEDLSISDFSEGIFVYHAEGTSVSGVDIARAGTGISVVGKNLELINSNVVDGVVGVNFNNVWGDTRLTGNQIERNRLYGIRFLEPQGYRSTPYPSIEIVNNIICGDGGNDIKCDTQMGDILTVGGNTFSSNLGCGELMVATKTCN